MEPVELARYRAASQKGARVRRRLAALRSPPLAPRDPADYVVILGGHQAGRVGRVIGPDQSWRSGRLLVRFPGFPFPRDFRSIADTNLRPANPDEVVKIEWELTR